MRRELIALLALVTACAGAEDGAAPSDESTDGGTGADALDTEDGSESSSGGPLPSPYADTDSSPPSDAPSLSADEVTTASVAGLRALMEIQPQDAIAAYDALFEPEEGCPEEFTQVTEGGTTFENYFTEGCTTSTGLTIRGAAIIERFSYDDGEGSEQGVSLSSDGTLRLEHSDGRWFQLTGLIYYSHGTFGDGSYHSMSIGAEISADPATTGNSKLLAGSVRGNVSLYASDFGESRSLGGSGSFRGDVLGSDRAMAFSSLLIENELCASEPGGSIAIRDAQAHWHDVVFDAVTMPEGDIDAEPEVHPDLCDGCGAFYPGGTENGTACMAASDLSALLNWETQPW